MKTVLITGDAAVPAPLREIVERGSTSVIERRAADITDTSALDDADRIVVWSRADDAPLRQLAEKFAAAEAAQRREVLVFVVEGGAGTPGADRLSPNEQYVWPRDEDRLKMAFMTGA